MQLRIKAFDPTKPLALPSYQSDAAAGLDLVAAESSLILPGQRALVGTNLCIELAFGYEAQIRPRSGLAFKHGITVLNAPGTIDADYRGEIRILLVNLGNEPFPIKAGDRIAQMIIAPVMRVEVVVVGELSTSNRGEKGFGSTGFSDEMGQVT